MSKAQKRPGTASKTLQPSKKAKSLAGSVLTQKSNQSAKSGRFMEGVRKISSRDRVGLIKLADR